MVDWLEWGKLVVELVKALAWPTVALVSVLLVKPHIAHLVPRIRSMKGLGVEVALEQAGDAVAESKVAPADVALPVPDPTKPDTIDVSSQFVAAWESLVVLLREIGAAHKVRSKDPVTIAYVLKGAGLIDMALVHAITNLRSIRNAFVHGERRFEVAQMVEFVGLSEQVFSRLSSVKPGDD